MWIEYETELILVKLKITYKIYYKNNLVIWQTLPFKIVTK